VEELATRTADGVTLRIDRVPPTSTPRGAVICLHAMMTDGRYFGARRPNSFATELAAAGLDVYVPDFRGHGRSVPPYAGRDDWSFDDLVERDLPAIVVAVAAASNMQPSELAILGHSLGGLVTTAALGTGQIPAPRVLVLAATSVWLHSALARRALMAAYRGVTALFGKAPIRAIRAGTADEAATYVGQLTGWTRTARWTSLRGTDYLAGLAAITTPTHAFAGAGDWMCRPDDARGFASRIRSCSAVRIVGRRQRDRLDPDHFQLFTRPELTTLRGELTAWLTLP
jgi:alpha-beta hydrolase superfamily lysophospholipase